MLKPTLGLHIDTASGGLPVPRAAGLACRFARFVYTHLASHPTAATGATPMLAKLFSCAILGLDGGLIEVEVDISQGLPAFAIVGI